MSPDVVLATLARLGGSVDRILIVGCQPAVLDEGMGLSPAVAAAVDGRRRPVPPARRPMIAAAQPKGEYTDDPPLARSLVLAAVAGLVIKSLPDIARYLKMREM